MVENEKYSLNSVKSYLKRARTLDLQINVKLDELHNLKQLATCISSPKMGDKVKSSKENNSMSTVDKIIDLQNTINSEIDKLVDLKNDIHEKIEMLDNPVEKVVLTERYLNVKSWEEIAIVVGYAERNTKNIHGRALQNFARLCTFLH